MLQDEKIVVIGLGYVGLPLAVEFARGRRVVGFDIDEQKVKELNAAVDRTGEVGSVALKKVSNNFEISSDSASLANGSIFIVTVPTPITETCQPDFSPLLAACDLVGPYLTSGSIVIFESTVYPGCTEEMCVPVLEKKSGLRCDLSSCDSGSFSVGYSPERINPGDKLHRLHNIIKVVSGSSPSATTRIKALYDSIIVAGTYLAPSIKVAEAAKAIENAQRDINIAFVNELTKIFNKMGLSTHDVLAAARTKWNFLDFRPGLVGGHCIGVDPYYLAYGAHKVGINAELVVAGRRINDGMSEFLVEKIRAEIQPSSGVKNTPRLGVLGLTFKEDCPDVRNSKVIDLVEILLSDDVDLKVYDPVIDSFDVPSSIKPVFCELESFVDLDAILILVPHTFFVEMDVKVFERMARPGKKLKIFDLKNIFRPFLRQKESLDWIDV